MGFSDIVGLRYNPDIAYVNIFNDGKFKSLMWVLPKFVLVYGFIMQIVYVMYFGTIGILYHDMGIVIGIPSNNIDFKGTMYVLHFGFCSMMNVYRITNSLGARICFTSFNHGKGSKVPFHSCRKPHQVLFFKQGLGVKVWDTPWRAK
jgi:hypothetical protein